ncbi:MAG: beta-ketoacyl-ACP synthase III [Thermosynechococcaceae cyanobacterium]
MQYSGSGLAITGCGSAVPAASLDNHTLSQIVETSDEWIATRTGIRSRHVASPQETLVDLAVEASKGAIATANINPEDLDLIILATSTPDELFGTAGKIQYELGAKRAVAFDLTAACSGFVFGLVTAAQFIRTGVYKNVLLIGADILSRWVDWSDRRTCILFGDGAGAVVLQANEPDRLLGFMLQSDGEKHDQLNLAYQPEAKLLANLTIGQGGFAPITMNGQEIYRFAVKRVPEVLEKALFHAHCTTDDIDWLILHQANQRILDAVAQRMKISAEKVVSNMAQHGNTSAASIPLALDAEVRQGKIKVGDKVAIAGFGAGLSWGAAIFTWGR